MRSPLPLALVSLLALLLPSASADPASIPFSDCFDEQESINQKLDVNTVYAQVLQNAEWGKYLNLTVVGTSRQGILGMSNNSTSLSTLFTTTSVLTLNAWTNSSYLCENMRPPSPLPAITSTDDSFCPVVQGPFAFSSTIPWGRDRELTTLITQLRAVDPFGKELLCIDMNTTPLNPREDSPYGKAHIIFWATVALAISYWVVVGVARISSAWGRGISRQDRNLWSRVQSAGFILASAISGERLATSPALMRFCTPSFRDVIFHTQWCAILAMVAVEWPQFAYPLLTQTSWSTLTYNISLTQGSALNHWNPFNTTYSPPTDFADQFSDPTSPIFIDRTVPNVLFTLPSDAKQGMSSFAYTIGLRPQDLFPTCMILFLGIISATIVISVIVWAIDYIFGIFGNSSSGPVYGSNMTRLGARARSPPVGLSKDMPESLPFDESKLLAGSSSTPRSQSKFALPLASAGVASERGINSHRSWWRLRSDIGTFHGSVLHGNLVRILVLFHLPVTVFSCYQMTMSRSVVEITSIVLAALSFIIFSILIPAHLVIRVTFTTTNKLYDETKTLLALGPLYNHYRHGSQLFASLFFATNIAFGVTVGAGQKSGTAQAIIILVVEVASALVTSIWLPWGSGASMGLISFLFCVARIVIAVLLVILTQAISIGAGPGGWVAYGILVILALVYFALVFMLAIKIIEAVVRIVGGIGFERSRHTIDSGLVGACGLLGCCGTRRRRRSRRSRRRNKRNGDATQDRDSDLSSYMPPPGGIVMNDGAVTPPRFLNAESRKNSTYSQPPSVLKPEQAFKPYVEPDNEDEGFIMGAWQPFPRQNAGYTSVGGESSQSSTVAPKPSTPVTSSTGFSRVGGGRAHIDTPYAITAASASAAHVFPSIGQQSTRTQQNPNSSSVALINQPPHGYGINDNRDEPLNVSSVEMGKASTGVAIGANGLPAGAMMPAHTRTKSQTAIVEDYLPPVASSSSVARQFQTSDNQPPARPVHLSHESYLRPPEVAQASKFTLGPDNDEDSDDEQDTQRKKKPWYHIRRARPHSTEGRSSAAASTTDLGPKPASGKVDDELGGVGGGAAQAQRSFVVIRKPQGSMARLNQDAGSSQDGAGTGAAGYPRRSDRPPTR